MAPTPRKRRLLPLCGSSLLALQLAAAVGPAASPSLGLTRPAHAQETSCFTAGTLVLMADGRERPIEALRPGDAVLGRRGRVNRVVGCERTRLGRRRLYGLNGRQPFVTAEHPFLSVEGWKALDPVATRRENARLLVAELRLGDRLCRGMARVGGDGGRLFVQACSLLEAVAAVDGDPETPLFNLLLDGDRSYVADGWIVHNKGGDEGGDANAGGAAEGGGAEGEASDDGGSSSRADGGTSGDGASAAGGGSDGGAGGGSEGASDRGGGTDGGGPDSGGGPGGNGGSGGGGSESGGTAGDSGSGAGGGDSGGGGDASGDTAGGAQSAGDGGTSSGAGAGDGGASAGDAGASADAAGGASGGDVGAAGGDAGGAGDAAAGSSQGGADDGTAAAAGAAEPGIGPTDAAPAAAAAGVAAAGAAAAGAAGPKADARPGQATAAPSARAAVDSFLKALGFRDSADAGLEPKGAPLSRAQEQRVIEEGWRRSD